MNAAELIRRLQMLPAETEVMTTGPGGKLEPVGNLRFMPGGAQVCPSFRPDYCPPVVFLMGQTPA